MRTKLSFDKFCNIALAIAFCITIFYTQGINAYAYDEASSYVNEEGNWEVDNADGPTASVSMYMMVQPECSGTSGFRSCYWFWCNEGEFNYLDGRHDTSAGMNFFFRAENADVVEVWEGNEIWFWHFNIEPGTYQFSEPEGINNITVLTQSLGSTLRADGYNEAEETVVEDGDEIRLYCMFGEWEWRKADGQMEALQAYAQKREEELSYGRPKDTENSETVTITVEGIENIPEEIKETPAPTSEPDVFEEEQFIETSSSEKESSLFDKIFSYVKIALVAVFVLGVLYITRKNKNNE